MIAFSKIKPLAIILNSGNFCKTLPPQAVRNNDGNVPRPNKHKPIAAKNGLAIAAAIRNALYKSPQGINPKIMPSKYPLKPCGFWNKTLDNFLGKNGALCRIDDLNVKKKDKEARKSKVDEK